MEHDVFFALCAKGEKTAILKTYEKILRFLRNMDEIETFCIATPICELAWQFI